MEIIISVVNLGEVVESFFQFVQCTLYLRTLYNEPIVHACHGTSVVLYDNLEMLLLYRCAYAYQNVINVQCQRTYKIC